MQKLICTQERAKAVETQLINATAELEALQEQHQKLEARHILLKKLSQINQQSDVASEARATVSCHTAM